MDECAPSSPFKRVRIIGGIALIVASIALSGSSEIGGAISSLTFTMPAIAIGDEVLTEGDERGTPNAISPPISSRRSAYASMGRRGRERGDRSG